MPNIDKSNTRVVKLELEVEDLIEKHKTLCDNHVELVEKHDELCEKHLELHEKHDFHVNLSRTDPMQTQRGVKLGLLFVKMILSCGKMLMTVNSALIGYVVALWPKKE
jgi:FtsZ-binding cell division protein ZapB